jgi:hypothetical protein
MACVLSAGTASHFPEKPALQMGAATLQTTLGSGLLSGVVQ